MRSRFVERDVDPSASLVRIAVSLAGGEGSIRPSPDFGPCRRAAPPRRTAPPTPARRGGIVFGRRPRSGMGVDRGAIGVGPDGIEANSPGETAMSRCTKRWIVGTAGLGALAMSGTLMAQRQGSGGRTESGGGREAGQEAQGGAMAGQDNLMLIGHALAMAIEGSNLQGIAIEATGMGGGAGGAGAGGAGGAGAAGGAGRGAAGA